MPKIENFQLKNFKGAADVNIDVGKRASSPIITLIGLNESGKTTILEGISYFVTTDNVASQIFEGVHSKSAIADIIPVDKKAAFTGVSFASAKIKLEQIDLDAIKKLSEEYSIDIDLDKIGDSITVRQEFHFVDSIYKSQTNRWFVNLWVRNSKKSKYKEYQRPSGDLSADIWYQIVNNIRSRIPKVVYFPTFLVDMPRKIYLQEFEGETSINRYYRDILQDILNSIDKNLSIENHVNKRIVDFKKSEANPLWISVLYGAPTKTHIDSVVQKIANAVTKEVIGSWIKIFNRPSGARNIIVEWNINTQKDDIPYVSFYVSDGESRYAISERSLGFRWFFSFLLFTGFKQASACPTIFLFDEPAANLHARAQAELLRSFERITSAGNYIIYSTHSHHMINPRWLSSAYIIENKSIDYDSDEMFEINSKPTNIAATNYRDFVSHYPNRSSYFQPVTEKLEYVAPELVGVAPFLILEGITDYYAFRYVKDKTDFSKSGVSLMPGTGAGSSGPLISYLIGRGEVFLVLLDDDEPGRKAAAKYRDDWYLTCREVKTLGELCQSLKNSKLESLIGKKTREKIKEHFSLNKMPDKKIIGRYLAEVCATSIDNAVDDETMLNIRVVIETAFSSITLGK